VLVSHLVHLHRRPVPPEGAAAVEVDVGVLSSPFLVSLFRGGGGALQAGPPVL